METSLSTKKFVLICVLSSMMGCQEEEFFEKNYLEKVGVPNPEIIDDALANPELPIELDDPQFLNIRDSFTQNSESKPVDILWVVDNSGSMQDEQEDLANNFSSFIQSFSQRNIDFQMSIITTDTSLGKAGVPVTGSIEKLTSSKMQEDHTKFIEDFASLIKVGVTGSGYEKGIEASDEFIRQYQNSFIRDEAYLVTVYVSDEEDQSELTPKEYYDYIASTKLNSGLYKAYSIVDINAVQGANQYILAGHARYNEMVTYSNGKLLDLRSNFASTLSSIGDEISSLATQFPLSRIPVDKTMVEVLVNQQLNINWIYNESSNSIEFTQTPEINANIEVNYPTKK